MFEKTKAFMEDHLKAFGVDPLPPIIDVTGKGLAFRQERVGPVIIIGRDAEIDTLPMAEWLVVIGSALLHQAGSDIASLNFGPEADRGEAYKQLTDDIFYIADLASIYQCYLQNPLETYCIYDEAIERKDEASLHPIAVALGLSHPRGLVSMGFEKDTHAEIFEEAEFFKPLITQKRPDLALLVALHNAWQKQKGTGITITKEGKVIHFSQAD
ncbi:hypothetical protein ACXWTF_03000 [Thiomicrolovo sp. ZZH C-3]